MNKFIPETIIETVKTKADIVDVIGEYVTLKKRGNSFKGLCPFHDDTTPSLSVSREKGVYKCFSCNAAGDVITFLVEHLHLSFPDAIKMLAEKYGIEIPSEEQSAEEVELQKKRDAMYIANQYAQEFFVAQLHDVSDESQSALEYVTRRWPLDFVKSYGIGYASKKMHAFADYAKEKGLSQEILLEVGLISQSDKSGKLYDTFHGRITIPIRDNRKRIVGYTARQIPEVPGTKTTSKYINSKTSLIFEKGNELFGIDYAAAEARMVDEMNIVEGGPDVLRLLIVGTLNTVASLGTAWTNKQLQIIKRLTSNINIIPDTDIAKDGKDFGAGFQSAFRTAKMAMELGMHVTIQEIPSEGKDSDPDDYITSKDVLESLTKTDFVMWYAKKLFDAAGDNTVKQVQAIHEIVDTVQSVRDIAFSTIYIDKLADIYGKKDMWENEILGKNNLVPLSCAQMTDEEYTALFSGSGVEVGKNYYFAYGKNGQEKLSNFIMLPQYFIRDGMITTRVFILRNIQGKEVRIEFNTDDLTTLQKFTNRIEREINYIWHGTSKKFTSLRGVLYSNMEEVSKISTLGWQKQGFYAFGNGIVYDGEWFPVDEEGIVRLESIGAFYLPAFSKINENDADKFIFEQKFVHRVESNVRFYAFASKLFEVYGTNAIIGICFIIACLFRDIIIRYKREFPSLFLFGPKGTGKTAFGELLQSPFVYCGDHPNLRTSTMASLAVVLSQAENAVIHLDEYKNDIDMEKVELLKGLWDCQGRSKLNLDTHKREQSNVLSGVIISGQEKPTIDIALYSRQCVLPFCKDTHTIEEKANFRTLKDYEHEGTSHVLVELLQIRKVFEQKYPSCYEQAVKDICSAFTCSIDERILHNWSVLHASYMASNEHIKFPFSYEQVFKSIISGVEYQNEECLHSNELSVFWKTVNYLKQDNQIFGLCDYRILEYTELKVSAKIDGKNRTVTHNFGESKKILVISTNSRLFTMYAMHLQKIREKIIPDNTLKFYIENSPEYLGKMNSVRFASLEDVKSWPERYSVCPNGNNSKPRIGNSPVQGYCLDFEAVELAYGTNLYSDYMGFDLTIVR